MAGWLTTQPPAQQFPLSEQVCKLKVHAQVITKMWASVSDSWGCDPNLLLPRGVLCECKQCRQGRQFSLLKIHQMLLLNSPLPKYDS